MRLMPLASAALGASLVCGILPAQSKGKEGNVEFIGLESWSPEKLAAAVKDKCKGHYCAATLKQDLGFAEAAVMIHAGSEPRTVVAVVEPQFAARVRYKPAPEGAVFVPRGWETGVTLVEKKPMAFQAAVLQHALVLTEGADAGAAALEDSWSAADISGAREAWAFFKERSSAADCAQAVWCVDRAASVPVRQLAAAILMSFHRDDVAWWALADGLRDSDDRVKMTCQQVLFAMGKRCARPVDWKPAVPALRAVLDGTNLFAFGSLARVLDATAVAPDLAPDLLAGAGHALLAHCSAKGEDVRKGAVALLERLSGKRLAGPEEWADWVGKLETREPASRR